MTDTQTAPPPSTAQFAAAPPDVADPSAVPPARAAWHRRRWVRITALAVAAFVALGGAFGAGTLVGRTLGPVGGPPGFSQDGFPQGGPGGMTPPDGDGFGQAPGSTDGGAADGGGTTSDGSGA